MCSNKKPNRISNQNLLRTVLAKPAAGPVAAAAVVDAAVVSIHERPHLAVAGGDNSLRFWLLDASG